MASDSVKWHRLVGILLRLIFWRLRDETQIKVDLSQQQQFFDIIVVRKSELPESDERLPPVYWQDFGELNEHNLTRSSHIANRSMRKHWKSSMVISPTTVRSINYAGNR